MNLLPLQRKAAVSFSPCRCAAYKFPHRPSSGKCETGTWGHYDGYCTGCGKACQEVTNDEGFGYEFGSIVGFHSLPVKESDCCMMQVVDQLPEDWK